MPRDGAQVDGSGPPEEAAVVRGQPRGCSSGCGRSIDGKGWRGGGGRGGMWFFSACELPFCVPACCKFVGGETSDPAWAGRRWLLTESRGWASEAQGRKSSGNNNNGGGGYEKKQATPNAG